MVDINAKVHDKFSVEFKLGFVVRRKLKQNNFAVNTWFFVPNSLDINSMTYPKERFYSDIKSNIRLITPVFLLREIVAGNAVPLHNLENAFNAMASSPTRTSVHEYEYQIKMFMAIFKSAIRNELQHIIKKVQTDDLEYLCKSYLDNLYLITSKYRDLRKIINVPTVSDTLLNNFHFGDEFMSNSIEQHTFQLINAIKSFSQKQEEIVDQLKNLILYEQNYKKEKGYLVVEKKSPGNNQELVFRLGILKKYIESDLFLKSNKRRDGDGIVIEQVYYSIAAGISMIFATAVAFAFQQRYGNFTMPLFVALVVSYMLKDRIKDLIRYYFAYKLGAKYFDHRTTLKIKDILIGWMKEGVDFITEDHVPREVLNLRNRSPLLEAENRINDEKIMLYRKRVQIDREKMETDSKYTLSGINEIMRFHINHFIQKADDPKVPIYTLDENNAASIVEGDKVYYLNIIMQFRFEEELSYRRFRVVFSRTGILRIEEM